MVRDTADRCVWLTNYLSVQVCAEGSELIIRPPLPSRINTPKTHNPRVDPKVVGKPLSELQPKQYTLLSCPGNRNPHAKRTFSSCSPYDGRPQRFFPRRSASHVHCHFVHMNRHLGVSRLIVFSISLWFIYPDGWFTMLWQNGGMLKTLRETHQIYLNSENKLFFPWY